jgi:hypothetical protein
MRPRSTVTLEKFMDPQLAGKRGNWRFIIVVCSLSHTNQTHILTSCYFQIIFKIILPSMPTSSKLYSSFRLSDQEFVSISHLPRAYYMPYTLHSFLLDHYKRPNIWWRVQIIKLLVYQLFPTACFFYSLKLKYSPQCSARKYLKSVFVPHCERPIFFPIQIAICTKKKIIRRR